MRHMASTAPHTQGCNPQVRYCISLTAPTAMHINGIIIMMNRSQYCVDAVICRELMTGADTLKNVAQVLEYVDRISEVKEMR